MYMSVIEFLATAKSTATCETKSKSHSLYTAYCWGLVLMPMFAMGQFRHL